MKTIFFDKLSKIAKIKKKLEEVLKIKISMKKEEISIEGKPEDEYIAEKVLDALNLGFPFPVALLIKKEDYLFEILNIKDYTKRKDFAIIRARIIGKGGKTLKTLAELSNCFFEIRENTVGIIGSPELIKNATDALISLIKGSKQANVYSYLEKHRLPPMIDLGLKRKAGE